MEVKGRPTFFAQVNVNDFTGGTAREFCDTNAVLRQFTSTKAKINQKLDIQLADLQVLIVFGWVLSKDQQECVTMWRSSAVAANALVLDGSLKSSSSVDFSKTKAISKSKAGIISGA